MRRLTIFGLVAAGVLTASCAQLDRAPASDMAWSLHHTEQDGDKLAFGAPQSDNVLVMMTCRPRSGQVLFSMVAPAAAPIEIRSKGAKTTLVGEAGPAMTADAVMIEAISPTDDPALASFARTGDLAVAAGGRRIALPADRQARRTIADFFSGCGAV